MPYRTILLLFWVFNKLLVRSVTQINLLLVKRFNVLSNNRTACSLLRNKQCPKAKFHYFVYLISFLWWKTPPGQIKLWKTKHRLFILSFLEIIFSRNSVLRVQFSLYFSAICVQHGLYKVILQSLSLR